jgi:3-hydroxypropanoate dehydrogenase
MNQHVNVRALKPAPLFRDRLDDPSLDLIFRQARSHNGWLNEPVSRELLEEAIDLAKLGPTSANASPFRVLFVESDEAKERLKPLLNPGNVEKTVSAPVVAITAHDLAFHQHMPKLFPHNPGIGAYFASNEAVASHTASQSGALQVAYFLLALRAVGLDAGPIGGFDKEKVDAEFFAGTTLRSNLIVNIGYGDRAKLFPRSPRLAFDEIARFA